MKKISSIDNLRIDYNNHIQNIYTNLKILHSNSNVSLTHKFCEIFGESYCTLFENLCNNINLINYKRVPIVVYYEDCQGIKGFCVLNVHIYCVEILWFCSYEKNKGFGTTFWNYIVHFVKTIGKCVILIHSTENALLFWLKRDNVKYTFNQYGIVETMCKQVCNENNIKIGNNINTTIYKKIYKNKKFLWDFRNNESKYVIIDLNS